MLVLSRKKNEKIVIDNGRIVVQVVEVRGDRVRIGIVAPREVPVYRQELVPEPASSKATTQQENEGVRV